VAVADFNGDGKLDAVTSDADTGTVSLMMGNGNGSLTYVGAYAVGASPSAVVVGDFNGDGRPDVAAANAGSNTVSVLLNDGTWPPLPPPPPMVRIHDATVMEGNTGTVAANFTFTLSTASTKAITIAYATGSASRSDYRASGTSPIGSWNGSAYTGVSGMIQSRRITASLQPTQRNSHRRRSGAVAVKFTYAGDANLDGKLNIDD
jgi:hypothetical protein